MLTALLTLALAPVAVAADPLAADSHLLFQGGVAALEADRTPGEAQKTFDLHLFVAQRGASGTKLFWQVEESGRGRWPWTERFGTLTLNAELKSSSDGPSLLYDRGDGTSILPLILPFLAAPGTKPLSADLRWTEETEESRTKGKWQFHAQPAKRDGRNLWQVQVGNGLGHQRTAWVERDSPLVVALKQRVFMGMGQEYELQMKHVETKELAGDEKKAALEGLASLIALRGKLKLAPRSEEVALDAGRLALLQEGLPGIQRVVTTGPVVKLVTAARRELATQSDRAGALEKLAEARQGKPAPDFSARGLSGETLKNGDLKGAVTVLHFWEYSDTPLKQPYGQVGYLDFLYGKRKPDGVKIYGVAVDSRLGEERAKDAAERGVRRLVKFMNLGYPVLLDDGELLKAFGDPRLLGAALPLYVVIGPDGKTAHYKVGYYEVDRLEGLKELNAIISEQLKAKK